MNTCRRIAGWVLLAGLLPLGGCVTSQPAYEYGTYRPYRQTLPPWPADPWYYGPYDSGFLGYYGYYGPGWGPYYPPPPYYVYRPPPKPPPVTKPPPKPPPAHNPHNPPPPPRSRARDDDDRPAASRAPERRRLFDE